MPLARYAGLTGLATLMSRLLGLVRDQELAAFFGAGNAMDEFVVAVRILNLVRDLFVEARRAPRPCRPSREFALKGNADAWRLGNHV